MIPIGNISFVTWKCIKVETEGKPKLRQKQSFEKYAVTNNCQEFRQEKQNHICISKFIFISVLLQISLLQIDFVNIYAQFDKIKAHRKQAHL